MQNASTKAQIEARQAIVHPLHQAFARLALSYGNAIKEAEQGTLATTDAERLEIECKELMALVCLEIDGKELMERAQKMHLQLRGL